MKRNKLPVIVLIYAELVKTRLSLAVTFSAVTGYFISQKTPDLNLLLLVSGVFLLAAGAGVLNQHTEAKYDALMTRTKGRPLPLQKISAGSALIFALCLLSSGIVFLLFIGFIPTLLGISCVFLYNFVYTLLKRVTIYAIVPGAMVGAIPPFIGSFASANGLHGIEVAIFSGFMFLWQLPHFWLILIKYHEDYETAGFVILSFKGGEKQKRFFVFCWAFFSSVLLVVLSLKGVLFNNQITTILVPANVLFILYFYFLLFRKREKEELRSAFMLINIFSLLIMTLFIVNSFL